MRLLSVLALVGAAVGCTGSPPVIEAGCTNTAECARGEVCSEAACVTLAVATDAIVGETVYALKRTDADKCAAVSGDALDDFGAGGTGDITQRDCSESGAERFWAVDKGGASYAFVNARSGRCISVEGGSSADDANVVQLACDSKGSQLWSPFALPTGGFLLQNVLSGRALGIAGGPTNANGSTGNAGDIRQVLFEEGIGAEWLIEPAATRGYVTWESRSALGNVWTLTDGLEVPLAATVRVEDSSRSRFRMVPGLANPQAVSFQSKEFPDRYLRHALFFLRADPRDGTELFDLDATFFVRDDLALDPNPDAHSFESINIAGSFIANVDGRLKVATGQSLATVPESATFFLRERD
jgi:hypothetical protein